MSYDKAKLAKHLAIIIQHSTSSMPATGSCRHLKTFGGAGTEVVFTPEGGDPLTGRVPDDAAPTLFVYDQGCNAWDDFVNECLLDDEIESLIGEEAISVHLLRLVRHIMAAANQATDYATVIRNDFLKPLRHDISEWQLVVPLVGIHVEADVTIGNVTIVPHDTGKRLVADRANNFKFGGTAEVQDASRATFTNIAQQLSDISHAWAVTSIRCHQQRIRHIAPGHVESALNVIRVFTHMFFRNPRLHVVFGLPRDVPSGRDAFFGVSNQGTMTVEFAYRANVEFSLSNTILESLKKHCAFDELAEICGLLPEQRTSLQQVVFVAMHWLGKSVVAPTLEDAFTQCTISLERLLILDNEESTAERFAERLAFLLWEDVEQRQTYYRSAKRLYDTRSKIVHAGLTGIDEVQRRQLEWFAMGALIKVAMRCGDLESHTELKEFFDRSKFN